MCIRDRSNSYDVANCVRAISAETNIETGTISELCCNIDDMTGEDIAFAVKVLLEEGALDVYTTPIYMKKNRPAIMLNCMCKNEDKDKILKLMFKHTSTTVSYTHLDVYKRQNLENYKIEESI